MSPNGDNYGGQCPIHYRALPCPVCTSAVDVAPVQTATVDYHQVVEDPFQKELEQLLNRYSKENGSNTADFQLARYLVRCLEVFDETVRFREAWYGR